MSTETASVEPEVMLGTFEVHSTPATVLLILELHINSFLKLLLKHIAYLYVP
jgi:hypothetical protein